MSRVSRPDRPAHAPALQSPVPGGAGEGYPACYPRPKTADPPASPTSLGCDCREIPQGPSRMPTCVGWTVRARPGRLA
jgi:hypothetical protein